METENSSAESNDFSHRSWGRKFQVAIAGLVRGVKGRREGQGFNSFVVHIPTAVVVVVLGITLGVEGTSMALLVLCIGVVFVTELINTSLELMAKAVTSEANEHVGAALDVASGAVLMASLTAVVAGAIVFGWRVVELLGW
jgi:diacylglycerol kinase (ATP)